LTAIDYTAGIWLEKTAGRRKKAVLLGSLSANLAFLGSSNTTISWPPTLPCDGQARNFVFPRHRPSTGHQFSHFSEHGICSRRLSRGAASRAQPVDYALFIAFFPQLVAGPIVRAGNFFRDLFHWQPPSAEDLSRGAFLVVLGLTKKMAFADQFAKVANAYFGNVHGNPGTLTAWSGVCAFGLQIYFDFSGYTDMAIGMAKLLGFHFPVNFRRPYLAQSITDFWHRWHISLSTWLRDYLYIPLGGSRHGPWMTYRTC